MNSSYTRGRAREYRSMDLLETAGYSPLRMAGSHGVWDVVGISASGIVLVQVKLGCRPTLAEMEEMVTFPCPPNGTKLLHLYQVGKHLPTVEEV